MSKRKNASRNLTWRNGVAYARIQVDGQDKRVSLHTRDRKEAESRVKEIQDDADRIRSGEGPRVTYEDAVVSWIETGYGGVKPGTAERYKISLRMLDEHFAGRLLDKITRKTIGEFVRKRVGAGVSHATVRRDLTALSRLFSSAVAMGYTDHNPAREWDRTVIKERREPIERPDMRSVAAFIAAAPFPINHLTEFLLENGSRLEETADLLRGNIDRNAGQATFTKTKATRPRTLTLSAAAVAVLAKIPAPNLPSPFVFWNPDSGVSTNRKNAEGKITVHGPRLRNLSRRASDIHAAAERQAKAEGWAYRRFRLHDLRHEYAIRWLEAGRSIYTLQKHLGHTSVKTTEIYLDFVAPEAAAAAKEGKDTGRTAATASATGRGAADA